MSSEGSFERELKGGDKKEYKPPKHKKSNKNKGVKMSFIRNGRRYYKSYLEALRNRRKGDRIYYDAEVGAYYIVRPSSSSWGIF